MHAWAKSSSTDSKCRKYLLWCVNMLEPAPVISAGSKEVSVIAAGESAQYTYSIWARYERPLRSAACLHGTLGHRLVPTQTRISPH